MKIIRFHNSAYSTSRFYEEEIQNLSFLECLDKVYSNKIYWSDAYSDSFNKLGNQAIDIISNDKKLQLKWSEENGISINEEYWQIEVIIAQLRIIKPDVVIFQNFDILPDEIIGKLKLWIKSIKILAVQIGYPRPEKDLNVYDILFPSHKYLKDKYNHYKKPTYTCQPAFDSRILKELHIPEKREHRISFMGSSGIGYNFGHSKRYWMLYEILRKTRINVYLDEERSRSHLKNKLKSYKENPKRKMVISDHDFKTITDILNQNDTFEHQILLSELLCDRKLREVLFMELEPLVPLKFMFHNSVYPHVYGMEYYKLMSNCYTVLNIHSNAAEGRVGNMKMFESSGVGSCMLVENGSNLDEMFQLNKEVVTYENVDDCIEKINYLSDNINTANEIGKCGQQRTLREHTVYNRCELLLKVFNEYI